MFLASFEYLNIIRKKTMEKIVVEEIRINKRKKKEKRWTKQATELGSTTKQIARKIDEKRAKAQFIAASTLATIVEMGDCFHHDFQIGGWANSHKYMGVNLGFTTWAQQ